MTIEEFLKKVKNPDDLPIIKKAYEFSYSYLKDKVRKNGDPQISHPLEVANILMNLNVDITTIVSAILHDVLDYGSLDSALIEKEFGNEVYLVVNSVAKINRLEMVDESESGAIYLRKVMVGLSEDVRVLFIKLADRLHNMRTMQCFSKENQKELLMKHCLFLFQLLIDLELTQLKVN